MACCARALTWVKRAGYQPTPRATNANAPWAGAFGVFLRLALLVVALRTAFHILLPVSG